MTDSLADTSTISRGEQLLTQLLPPPGISRRADQQGYPESRNRHSPRQEEIGGEGSRHRGEPGAVLEVFDEIKYRNHDEHPHDLCGLHPEPIGQRQTHPRPHQREEHRREGSQAPDDRVKVPVQHRGGQIQRRGAQKADAQGAEHGDILAGHHRHVAHGQGHLIFLPAGLVVADEAHDILHAHGHGQQDGGHQPPIITGFAQQQKRKGRRYKYQLFINTFTENSEFLINQSSHGTPPLI